MMAFETWLKLRAEEMSVEIQKVRNDRIRIYGSYFIAALLIIGAVVLGIFGQVELASALMAGSAVPATIAASLQSKK